jgi:hypothetical protein
MESNRYFVTNTGGNIIGLVASLPFTPAVNCYTFEKIHMATCDIMYVEIIKLLSSLHPSHHDES